MSIEMRRIQNDKMCLIVKSDEKDEWDRKWCVGWMKIKRAIKRYITRRQQVRDEWMWQQDGWNGHKTGMECECEKKWGWIIQQIQQPSTRRQTSTTHQLASSICNSMDPRSYQKQQLERRWNSNIVRRWACVCCCWCLCVWLLKRNKRTLRVCWVRRRYTCLRLLCSWNPSFH